MRCSRIAPLLITNQPGWRWFGNLRSCCERPQSTRSGEHAGRAGDEHPARWRSRVRYPERAQEGLNGRRPPAGWPTENTCTSRAVASYPRVHRAHHDPRTSQWTLRFVPSLSLTLPARTHSLAGHASPSPPFPGTWNHRAVVLVLICSTALSLYGPPPHRETRVRAGQE